MVKKTFVVFLLAVFITNCFAGFSSGGRAGYSGGRSYSSSSFRSSSNYSGRSGFSRPSTTRAYVSPRSYSYSRSYSTPSHTVINNHYSHGGYGWGGGSFFHGFMGGYLGGMMANNHNTTIVSGGVPVSGDQVIGNGQGAYPIVQASESYAGVIIFLCIIIIILASFSIITFINRRCSRW